MQKLKDSEGNEVEALTPEEAEAETQKRIEEEKAKWESANPDKAEIVKLQEELAKAKEDNKKLASKDLNFGNLRHAKEESDKKVSELTKKLDDYILSQTQNVYDDTLGALAGEDQELKEKIEFHFKRFGDIPTDKLEIQKRLRDAFTLAQNVSLPTPLDGISSSGAPIKNLNKSEVLSSHLMPLAQKMGITNDDIKNVEEYKKTHQNE